MLKTDFITLIRFKMNSRFHSDSVFFRKLLVIQVTWLSLAEKWRPLQSAAECQTNSADYLELKESYSKAHLPTVMKKFNITSVLTYFVQTEADFKVIREESFELFTAGHVYIGKNRCYNKHYPADFFHLENVFC